MDDTHEKRAIIKALMKLFKELMQKVRTSNDNPMVDEFIGTQGVRKENEEQMQEVGKETQEERKYFFPMSRLWGVTAFLLMFIHCTNSTEQEYYYSEIDIVCGKCKPGQKLVENCKHDLEISKCIACEEGTFQNMYSISKSCISCTKYCERNSFMEKNCSSTSDCICTCKEGYYRYEYPDGKLYSCLKHKACPAGEGVVQNGTTKQNPICAECPDGYFSNAESATESCKPFSSCKKGMTATGGSKTSDVKCVYAYLPIEDIPESSFFMPMKEIASEAAVWNSKMHEELLFTFLGIFLFV